MSTSKIVGKVKVVVCAKCNIMHNWEKIKEIGCTGTRPLKKGGYKSCGSNKFKEIE